jgi:hypothetical protein
MIQQNIIKQTPPEINLNVQTLFLGEPGKVRAQEKLPKLERRVGRRHGRQDGTVRQRRSRGRRQKQRPLLLRPEVRGISVCSAGPASHRQVSILRICIRPLSFLTNCYPRIMAKIISENYRQKFSYFTSLAKLLDLMELTYICTMPKNPFL